MFARLSTAIITLFWLTMMGTLVNKEILPAWHATRVAAQTPNYDRLETIAQEGRVTQMGIFLKDRRIGYTRSRVRRVREEIQLESRTEMRLDVSSGGANPMGGGLNGLDIGVLFKACVFEGELTDFQLTASSPPGTPPIVTVNGRAIGKSLTLLIKHGEESRRENIPFDAKQFISAGFDQSFGMPELRVGARWPIQSLDTTTYTLRTAEAEVVAEEEITLGETRHNAYRIEIAYGASKMLVWATEDGDVLKQKIFGFTFIREEPPPDALERKHL